MNSLLFRLMAAFILVIFVSIATIYLVANQATTNEFRSYMFRGGMSATDQIARDLAAYYRGRGDWQGVDQYLAQSLDTGMGPMMGGRMGTGMMGGPLLLADENGTVVGGRGGMGQRLSSTQIERGIPIQVDGRRVGTLIDPSAFSTAFDAPQQEFLHRVNISIFFAGIAAAVIALVLGYGLFSQITAPLNALATASREIAAGDLTTRVTNPRDDEVGQVGSAFNAMAESLAQSQAAQRNMIADVAHELRNPLGILQGQLEGMMDGVFPTTPEQIASLYDETLLLNRLVADLRDLALADAGQLGITRRSVEMDRLIEKTVAAFTVEAADKDITLKTDFGQLPPLQVDAQRIEQVLRNLIANALRYTPAGGQITVSSSIDPNNSSLVFTRVSDTGPGIPTDERLRVFERFWRADKSRSRAGGGAGLGLAIAKQLVEAHGGTIGVESPQGVGAIFWFKLPV